MAVNYATIVIVRRIVKLNMTKAVRLGCLVVFCRNFCQGKRPFLPNFGGGKGVKRMAIKIKDYSFEGPYTSTSSLEDKSGVYAILDYYNDKYYLLDVGESSVVKSRVESHERQDCWEENSKGTIKYAVYYTPHKQQSGRMEIEQDIRDSYDIPCGKR